jgi:hypothetical protein
VVHIFFFIYLSFNISKIEKIRSFFFNRPYFIDIIEYRVFNHRPNYTASKDGRHSGLRRSCFVVELWNRHVIVLYLVQVFALRSNYYLYTILLLKKKPALFLERQNIHIGLYYKISSQRVPLLWTFVNHHHHSISSPSSSFLSNCIYMGIMSRFLTTYHCNYYHMNCLVLFPTCPLY